MEAKYDLVLIRVDRIGDYILWHDTIGAYQKKYGGKKVLLICPSAVLPVTSEERFFTEIITYDHKKAQCNRKYLFELFLRMRKISAIEVIYPSWRRSVLGDILVCGLKSPKKIGMKGIPDVKYSFNYFINIFFNLFYSRLVESPVTTSEIKAIEFFTRQVISPDYIYGTQKLVVSTPNPINSRKYVVISFSAYNELRIWNIDKFVKLIDQIPHDFDVVLSGYGSDDETRANYIIANVHDREHIINMVSRTTIPQLISLISGSDFVIGNDSSAVHIAAATRTPSICILPGAHYKRFVPYPDDLPGKKYNPKAVFFKMDCFGCNYNCTKPINGAYECLNRITVEMVSEKMKEFLKEISYGRKN